MGSHFNATAIPYCVRAVSQYRTFVTHTKSTPTHLPDNEVQTKEEKKQRFRTLGILEKIKTMKRFSSI
jgi:hypothetical protein